MINSEKVTGLCSIAGRKIGPGNPCFIIAEIAQGHDGSLGTALAYIDAVAKTGVDAIKFQTHIAEAESTRKEEFRVRVFPQDETRYDYWERVEFKPEQWATLARYAEKQGLIFLSTPFSFEAIDLLEDLCVPAWKIGSGEVSNLPLLERVARTQKPVLLSSGMSPWSELDEAVECVRTAGGSVAVFQCTTSYPCPPEHLGLNVLDDLRQRYSCPVGLSDHSGTVYAAMAAATLGADLIEVHTVFSRECFGPDVSSSVTTSELKELVDGVRFIEAARNSPVNKDDEATEREVLRTLFGRSLVAARNLSIGHRLESDDIALKKPGGGLSAKELPVVIGRVITKAYSANEVIREEYFE